VTLLLLALAALLAAPPLALLARRGGTKLLQALDGFVLVAAGGLALLGIVPEALATAGPLALLAAALGCAIPALAEGLLQGHRLAHRLVLLLALAGLTLHAAVDGAALALGREGGPWQLAALGVVVHRLPFGLLLWLALRALFGLAAAIAGILALEVATLAGWLAAGAVQGHLAGRPAALLLALVAGGLLHLMVHQGRTTGGGRWATTSGAGGGLLGLTALLLVLGGPDPATALAGLLDLWGGELAPLLWLPVLAGGAVALLLAVPGRRRWLPPEAGVLHGLLAGWSAPSCSCGAGPLYEDALLHGASPAAATAFLHGATLLRPEALAVAAVVLPWPLALAWLASGLALALAEAWQAGRLALLAPPPQPHRHPDVPDPGRRRGPRLLREALDWLDHNAAWLAVAALLLLGREHLAGLLDGPPPLGDLPPLLVVAVLAVAATVVRLHPLAAGALVLVAGELGAPPAAALTLFLLGPTGGRSAGATLRRLHGRPDARRRLVLRLGVALGAALAWQLGTTPAASAPPLSAALALPLWATVLLALPLLVSWLRSGPRGWLAQVLPGEEHAHAHHPGRPHEHAGHEQVFLEAMPPE